MFAKNGFLIGLALVGLTATAELKTVPSVDLSLYAGRWYQIAANPLPFERGCACSQQTLSARQDGKIGVYNSCNRPGVSGALAEIKGVATAVDATNSKFLVDFGLGFNGDYWIIGIASDYQWAVVSDPGLMSLYILSKTPTLSADLYQNAVDTAALQTDTTKLKLMEQQGCSYPPL